MLFTIEGNGSVRQVTSLPHEADFRLWRARLSDADYNAIIADLNCRVGGKQIETSSWIPGADWRGTPFLPIWYACSQDFDASRKFFGLIVWQVMMDRPESWSFGRYDVNGRQIEGMTYFRIS
jgi:hypothetical protein